MLVFRYPGQLLQTSLLFVRCTHCLFLRLQIHNILHKGHDVQVFKALQLLGVVVLPIWGRPRLCEVKAVVLSLSV